MPELPEISLYKEYIDGTALHKKITELSFPDPSLLQSPQKKFEEELNGKELVETKRLGKYLLIKTSGESCLVFHFGMTGKLEYFKNGELPKYTKMLLHFQDGYQLAYRCRRKLGKIFLTDTFEKFREDHNLGMDALELSEKEFLGLLEKKTGSIKGVLTDQHEMAGIGNVYSDEMLYQSKIHPKTKTNSLSEAEKKMLYRKMKSVLETAIRCDGERSEFPSDYLTPHRKEGEACPKGSGDIKKIKVSGRSTYFCPSCQKEK